MKKRFFCVEDRARIDSVLLERPHRAAAQDCNAALEKRGVLHPPLPYFSFLHSIVRLFQCFSVRLYHCFPVPSSFRVPCSSVLTSRVKICIFTLIELLIVIASRIEQGKAEGAGGSMLESFEAVYERASRVFQRLCGIYREQLL